MDWSEDRLFDTLKEAPLVYVAVLNWKGAADTLRCLEAVFRLQYPRFRVVVCDNDSGDDSVALIQAWAAGRLNAAPPAGSGVRDCVLPPVAKPIACQVLSRGQAEVGEEHDREARLTIINTGANLGYAGGNNVALRFAGHDPAMRYVWVLNNDTLPRPDALAHMVERFRAKPQAGICGGTLRDMTPPHAVQAMGGARFNPWLGTVKPLGRGRHLVRATEADDVERDMSYVIGACMLISRDWLSRVGLMNEEYFLYYEEIDWVLRARDHRLRLAYAPRAVVYHHQGASAGGPSNNAFADGLALRNRLLLTRNLVPWALPFVWMGMFGVMLNRLRRGQRDRLAAVWRVMWGRWRWPEGGDAA